MRRSLYAEMHSSFVAGLSVALRRLRRRPKASISLSEIIIAVGATSDGFLLLYKLQPDLFDTDLVVETQWNLIWSMTEAGLLDPPGHADPTERTLVEAALVAYAAGRVPSGASLAEQCEIEDAEAIELVPSDEALAQRCMDYAVGNSVETEAIAVNVKGAELAAVRDLLIATTRQAEASPLLIDVIRQNRDGGFCGEARRHIAEALGQSDAVNLDRPAAEGVASMLLDAALQGAKRESRSGRAASMPSHWTVEPQNRDPKWRTCSPKRTREYRPNSMCFASLVSVSLFVGRSVEWEKSTVLRGSSARDS